MNTKKIAITIPKNILFSIDDISSQKGISRSRLISILLSEKIMEEKKKNIKETYDRIFSDKEIIMEQIGTAKWFEGSGNKEGQEW